MEEEAADPTEPSGPFDIYEAAQGPSYVANPVRRRILAMMRGRERTVSEMIALTGLGKSTLSAHLGQLGRQGLLDYREDPKDRRCKRYYLTSRHVGTAGPSRDRPPMLDPLMDLPLEQDGGLPRLLLRSLIAELACCGLDLDPVVRETGRRVGEVLGRERPAQDLEEWAAQATALWKKCQLGRLVIQGASPDDPRTHEVPSMRVCVESCRLCCHGDEQALRLCQVTAGLLEGMASESLGCLVEVRTTKRKSHSLSGTGQAAASSVAPDSPGAVPPAARPGEGRTEGVCSCVFEVHVAAEPPLV